MIIYVFPQPDVTFLHGDVVTVLRLMSLQYGAGFHHLLVVGISQFIEAQKKGTTGQVVYVEICLGFICINMY